MGRGVRGSSLVSGVLPASVPPVGLAAAYTFSPVDVPFAGVTETDANGVNNSGQIVGFYFDASGGHAFLDSGGMFSTLVVPGSSFTSANGINNAGLIVGHYVDANGLHGLWARAEILTRPTCRSMASPELSPPGSTTGTNSRAFF
jgi:uncharacterized membrane protein